MAGVAELSHVLPNFLGALCFHPKVALAQPPTSSLLQQLLCNLKLSFTTL